MPKTNCAVYNCGNSTQKLSNWKTQHCDIHGCNKGTNRCVCPQPFDLLPFPTRARSPERRKAWIAKLKRVDPNDPKKPWEPTKNSRVCSWHFVPGEVVLTLKLGYSASATPATKRKPPKNRTTETPSKKPRSQKLLGTPCEPSRTYGSSEQHLQAEPLDVQEPESDGDSSEILSALECLQCDELIGKLADKDDLIKTLKKQLKQKGQEITALNYELKSMKRKMAGNMTYSSVQHSQEKLSFYTGLPEPSSQVFSSLHSLVAPLVKRLWRGRAVSTKYVRRSPQKKMGPQRKLSSQDELLLALMRLRLGLMNKDVAYRFGISPTLASQIFTSWLKALHKVLRHLVYRPSKEAIIATKPARYVCYPDLRDIIDCSESFIDTPKTFNFRH